MRHWGKQVRACDMRMSKRGALYGILLVSLFRIVLSLAHAYCFLRETGTGFPVLEASAWFLADTPQLQPVYSLVRAWARSCCRSTHARPNKRPKAFWWWIWPNWWWRGYHSASQHTGMPLTPFFVWFVILGWSGWYQRYILRLPDWQPYSCCPSTASSIPRKQEPWPHLRTFLGNLLTIKFYTSFQVHSLYSHLCIAKKKGEMFPSRCVHRWKQSWSWDSCHPCRRKTCSEDGRACPADGRVGNQETAYGFRRKRETTPGWRPPPCCPAPMRAWKGSAWFANVSPPPAVSGIQCSRYRPYGTVRSTTVWRPCCVWRGSRFTSSILP